MGKIINSYIMPHPPVIVPGIGGGREANAAATLEGCRKAAAEIAKDCPDTIVISTPHAPCFRDFISVSDNDVLEGDFSLFGCPEISMQFNNNTALATKMIQNAEKEGIPAGFLSKKEKHQYRIPEGLDHGAMVPLYFILTEFAKTGHTCKLIHLSTPFLPLEELYRFGRVMQKTIQESDENVVYIASGDLSHRLTLDAPAGYSPKGREYDRKMADLIKNNRIDGLLEISDKEMDDAGECGTRSFVMMFGLLHGYKKYPEIFSYEGPFGVGYMTAKIHADWSEKDHKEADSEEESEYVTLARETLETYVREHRIINVPEWLPIRFSDFRAGTFVSLKKHGQLRGCIGTILPTQRNVAEEIIHNAIQAGIHDPRFEPVTVSELPELVYSVDILHPPEKISSMQELDVKRYGVIVTHGYRRGLLLPDLEGVDTPEEQVSIALQKAGISPGEPYEMERFKVTRYH